MLLPTLTSAPLHELAAALTAGDGGGEGGRTPAPTSLMSLPPPVAHAPTDGEGGHERACWGAPLSATRVPQPPPARAPPSSRVAPAEGMARTAGSRPLGHETGCECSGWRGLPSTSGSALAASAAAAGVGGRVEGTRCRLGLLALNEAVVLLMLYRRRACVVGRAGCADAAGDTAIGALPLKHSSW